MPSLAHICSSFWLGETWQTWGVAVGLGEGKHTVIGQVWLGNRPFATSWHVNDYMVCVRTYAPPGSTSLAEMKMCQTGVSYDFSYCAFSLIHKQRACATWTNIKRLERNVFSQPLWRFGVPNYYCCCLKSSHTILLKFCLITS